jgi:hypothetical protein
MDRIRVKKLLHFMENCTPIQARGAHFFCGRVSSFLSYALPAFKFLIGKKFRMITVIHGGTGKDCLDNVREFGLHLEDISHVVGGGGYTHKQFLSSLEKRRTLEDRGVRSGGSGSEGSNQNRGEW